MVNTVSELLLYALNGSFTSSILLELSKCSINTPAKFGIPYILLYQHNWA